MKNRAWLISGAVALGTYVSMAGCGDDEVENMPLGDAGGDAALAADTTSSDVQQQPDTNVTDTSVSDVTDAKRGSEQTGQACKVPNDCYTGFDAQALKGTAACIDTVTNGYCTHECTQDSDCCAVPGECRTGLKQVCAPFTNSTVKYCFLSCEPEDIANAADGGDAGVDAGSSGSDYCSSQASTDFGCRASGGGAPRKVCLPKAAPGDGGPDAADASDASDAMDASDG